MLHFPQDSIWIEVVMKINRLCVEVMVSGEPCVDSDSDTRGFGVVLIGLAFGCAGVEVALDHCVGRPSAASATTATIDSFHVMSITGYHETNE